ncbi:MAG: glycosyltransferase [Bacteroidales bacterium]|nr:glycosyltransferase [Prevotella sp.]MBR3467222.1 glycosyltransferase [Bacteroidales bacterium]
MKHKTDKVKYSFIVPVFNRPDEVEELLESLTAQKMQDFEVVVVEDGSQKPCKQVCERFADRLPVHYFSKENSGPGQSRNYGAERARGEYLVVLDSDVVLPEGYLTAVDGELRREPCDAFGGPDAANDSFTDIQKAISYSMTSFFTTGGIRGGRKKLDKFYPRSFNMGIRRDVYGELGGFSKMRFGEDIDFSIRIFKSGHTCRLFPEAWVWHKRRTDFRKFWRQVFNSGIARINLYKKHPESLKLVHLLPAAFTMGVVACVMASAAGRLLMHYDDPRRWYWLCAAPLLLLLAYALLIFADAVRKNRSPKIGLLSVGAAFVQLMGYGCGFLSAWWRRCVRGQSEYQAYEKNFYS